MKIVILGYSGAGKSTFAKNLHNHYQIPLLYLDTVHFAPNWVERSDEAMEKDMKEFISQDNWIMEGNYRRLLPQRYQDADKIFIFNINRITCLYQVIKRRIQYRNKQRESMTDGCKEKIDFEFFMWVIHNGRTKTRRKFFKDIKNKHGHKVIEFKNKRQIRKYLHDIGYKNV